MVDSPIRPTKVSQEASAPKLPAVRKPNPVELVRKLLADELLVRPVKLPVQHTPPIKSRVRRLKDRKPTLPTKVILPPRPVALIEKPMLLIKPIALLPPPRPIRKARVYLEPSYPTTSPRINRLPQQPSKFVLHSNIYTTVSEPKIIRDVSPLHVKPLAPRTTSIWTDLYRKQAVKLADEVVIVPDIKTLPPRPVRKVKPLKPLPVPESPASVQEWVDLTDFEMPVRGTRRRHLVMPTGNSFEKQMRDFTLEFNQHRLDREESQIRRNREIVEENIRERSIGFEMERLKRKKRTMSMPPRPRSPLKDASLLMDVLKRTEQTRELPRVTPLPPSKINEYDKMFKRQAAQALATSYSPSNNYQSAPPRRKLPAPSRLWMPSSEYHIVTDYETVKVPDVTLPVDIPVTDDYKLKMLKDDIELNKRRRNQLREQRLDELYNADLVRPRESYTEIDIRHKRMQSMPPLQHSTPLRRPSHRPFSPLKRTSPEKQVRSRRSVPPQIRGVSLPPQVTRPRYVPHLPTQPSKYWLPSGEYHHITEDEFKYRTEDENERAHSHSQENKKMQRLEEEFERDRLRRENRREYHQKQLALAQEEEENYNKKLAFEQQRRQTRHLSMPPMTPKEYVRAEHIPKAYAKPAPPPQTYKPSYSSAHQQELEIETITKRLNENIKDYEDSLKRRQHYAVPSKKVVAASSIHHKPKPKRKWSHLYTTVSQRIEDQSNDEIEQWVPVRKRRNKRHLVLPATEMSRVLTDESAIVPRVLISHRSAASRPSVRGSYNVVEIHEKNIDYTRQPLQRPHFTEDADFDSDWHAMAPHVHGPKASIKRKEFTTRYAPELQAPSYDKETPVADEWLSRGTFSNASSSETSSLDKESIKIAPYTKSKRHLVTPPFLPGRHSLKSKEPLSSLRLKEKAHHSKHTQIEMEIDEPEPVFRRRRPRASRHNLVMPEWNPGEPTSGRVTRRDTPPRARIVASSPRELRGHSLTPFGDSLFSSPSPVRPVSLGRRASVSHLPRATPARDLSYVSSFDQVTQRRESLERSGSEYRVLSRASVEPEHHVHPMRDTFKSAAERVREKLPWRQLYTEVVERAHPRSQASESTVN